MPDRDVAARLPNRSYSAITHMRRGLKIAKVAQLRWDGVPRPASVPLAEVLQRYFSRLGLEPPGAGTADGPPGRANSQ
jgi:hypothetical protein